MENKNKCPKTLFSKTVWAMMLPIIVASQPSLALDYLFVYEGEIIDLSEEVTQAVYVYSGGTLNVLGGAGVNWMDVYNGGTVNLKGGSIDGYGIAGYAGSTITVYGTYVGHYPETGAEFEIISNSLIIDNPDTGWIGHLTCRYEGASSDSIIPLSTDADIQFTVSGGPSPIPIDIDIKPGSYPNSINLGSHGVIPVAILSTADFDATTQVNPENVFLAGAGVRVRGKGNKYLASEEDVDGDGRLDLVVKVETENLDPGAFQDGGAFLRVHETSEPESPVVYEGWDEINIVPPE